jgi:transcriptional regulator GlxA family with amidase domain
MHFDILALRGSSLGGLAATGDALEAANRLGAEPAFSWRVVSGSRTASLRQGVTVAAEPFATARPARWIVVLGIGSAGPEEVEARLGQPDVAAAARWLRHAAANGSRIASACTGAFLLSEAGVLDGRRCTTSWWLQGLLARRTPAARVDADAMVAADDPVWTAGPAYAHLDLMLALLAEAASPEIAQSVGRRLSADRRLSQGAYIEPGGMGVSDLVSGLEAAVSARLSQRIRVEDLAAATGVSPRTLGRRVQAETGLSPMRFVQKVRLEAALRLIRAGRLPLTRVAERVGLADAATLHRLVVRHTRRAPGSFRTA